MTGRRKLDRETQADHELRVQACDQGNPKLCATVAVVLTVLDTNDNAPTFKSQAYDVRVPAERAGFLCRYARINRKATIYRTIVQDLRLRHRRGRAQLRD